MANKKVHKQSSKESVNYPPVVAVLGHVDHGKTTLLDAIRKTDVVTREHGGITQGIGASSIEIAVEGKKRKITFIDTPGHEAFSLMRGRGTQAGDLGLLVVSSIDGVMPQTRDSIKLLKEGKIPFIVVLTKIDLPEKNEDKVKRQLLKEEVLLEGYGGDVPYIAVSAKENINIKELLELILLVFDMGGTKDLSEKGQFKAIVIESRLDQKAGPRATIVIKNGSLSIRDEIICNSLIARVRTIINDKGQHLNTAKLGEAVEVLGFEKVPPIGEIVTKKGAEVAHDPAKQDVGSPRPLEIPPDFLAPKEEPKLSVILCADNLGSLEAISKAIPQEISIVLQKTGDISSADILLAKTMNAIVLGFNIKIKPEILKFASQEKVLVKNYRIIYELIDEIKDVLKGKELALEEEIYGKAKIIASFPFEKTKVLGIKVLEGRVARGDKVRLISRSRDKDVIIGEAVVSSLRVGKNSVSKVEEGHEGGILLSPFLDFTIGDMLICHS
ncbi:MAG: GTP-binding protein [Candidatus Levybacteria bacterium]|nr:GTP-binding protein [Candidatus Levybacteria bacterium]